MFVSWFYCFFVKTIKSINESILQKRKHKLTFTCSMLIKIFRLGYIAFAIYYVGESMYSTFRKYKEGRIVVSVTERDYPQHVYPSMTFCTKFTDGQKSSLAPYYEMLYQKARESGK